MNDIKAALTRKLGPFPAWAWLGVLAVGLWIYRRGGVGVLSAGTGSASSGVTAAGADASNGSLGQPFTVGPGESVYDPNTGQLVGMAPDQSGIGPDMSTSDTAGTAPGDTTGNGLSSAPTITNASPARKGTAEGFHAGHSRGHQYFLKGQGWVSKARFQAVKRKNKKTKTKGEAVPAPTGDKTRKRSSAKLHSPVRKKGTTTPPKGRGRGSGGSAAPTTPRTRKHKTSTHPVTRQHTAPSTHVSPHTQKVQPHPDAPPKVRAPIHHKKRRK